MGGVFSGGAGRQGATTSPDEEKVDAEWRRASVHPTERERQRVFAWIREMRRLGPMDSIPKEDVKRKRRIVIDTDIGSDIDDALALLLALYVPSEDIELVGQQQKVPVKSHGCDRHSQMMMFSSASQPHTSALS